MTDATTAPEHRLLDAAWRVDEAASRDLPAGTGMRTTAADATLVYALSGSVRVRPDAAGGATADLAGGDLLLVLGGAAGIRAADDARVVVASVSTVRGALGLAALPATIVVPAFASVEPAIAHLAAALGCHDEDRVLTPSDGLVCAHMATTILAAALRSWSRCDAAARDWRARAGDPHLGRALDAIRDDPGRAWTVGDLATLATMSRSSFALRFRAAVGMPPLQYVTQVRIAAAKQHLASGGLSVSQTARMLGYASEDGFSRAFRRATGASPSSWRAAAPAGVAA